MSICGVNGVECCYCQPVCGFRKHIGNAKDLVTVSNNLIEISNSLLHTQEDNIKKLERIFEMKQDLIKKCSDMLGYLAEEYNLNEKDNKEIDELLSEINEQLEI